MLLLMIAGCQRNMDTKSLKECGCNVTKGVAIQSWTRHTKLQKECGYEVQNACGYKSTKVLLIYLQKGCGYKLIIGKQEYKVLKLI